MKNWYIVQSYSSFEKKVADLIKKEAIKAKLEDKIEEVLVPTHEFPFVVYRCSRKNFIKFECYINHFFGQTECILDT